MQMYTSEGEDKLSWNSGFPMTMVCFGVLKKLEWGLLRPAKPAAHKREWELSMSRYYSHTTKTLSLWVTFI